MAIKHAFTSAKSDGADATLVQPGDWNDDHVVTAADVPIVDTANDFTATEVEGALAELQSDAEGHLAAADPHTGYQKESEKDAASGYAGLTAGTKIALAQLQEVLALSDLSDVGGTGLTYAQLQQVSATARVLGRITAGAGVVEELTAANLKTILALVAGDLPAHGAAQHTDITRYIWLAARGDGIADSGTNGSAGTAPDVLVGFVLADAATQGAAFALILPVDAVAASALFITLYWVPVSTDATPHTVRWSIDAIARVSGNDVTSAGTTTAFTGASSARTANQLALETTTQILASVTAGDLIRLNVRRVGGDGADTYVGNVLLIGARLEYTAAG